jgi:hypothetical protein
LSYYTIKPSCTANCKRYIHFGRDFLFNVIISDFPFDFTNGISARFDTFPEALQLNSSPIIAKHAVISMNFLKTQQPIRDYSTYLGGSGDDCDGNVQDERLLRQAVTTMSNGNIVVAGMT